MTDRRTGIGTVTIQKVYSTLAVYRSRSGSFPHCSLGDDEEGRRGGTSVKNVGTSVTCSFRRLHFAASEDLQGRVFWRKAAQTASWRRAAQAASCRHRPTWRRSAVSTGSSATAQRTSLLTRSEPPRRRRAPENRLLANHDGFRQDAFWQTQPLHRSKLQSAFFLQDMR